MTRIRLEQNHDCDSRDALFSERFCNKSPSPLPAGESHSDIYGFTNLKPLLTIYGFTNLKPLLTFYHSIIYITACDYGIALR